LDFATGLGNLAKAAAPPQTLPDARMYPESLNLRSPSDSPAAEAFVAAVCHGGAEELSAALAMVEHCLAQLSDEQIWHRDQPLLHAIGNTVLHLGGNLRQWIVCGLGGAPDERRRPDEFAAVRPIAGRQLLADLRASVDEARQVLAAATEAELLRVRRIQGFEMTGIAALWHAVPHFRGHTQELIRLTRQALGPNYRFAWTPTTPEEGAPS
jgi:uncharacterized damage-inducible protein DinB